MAKIGIIGSGFSGLSSACYLAAAGHEVHVYEKNDSPGGRARQFTTEDGFVFDMGPSWYWMPDVYDQFFKDFGYETKDFFQLDLLEPAFDMVFGEKDIEHIPAKEEDMLKWFEKLEKGGAKRYTEFMKDAEYKYQTAMKDLIYKPGLSIMEFANTEVLMGMFRMKLFSSFSKHIRSYFAHERILAMMEFPVLFLGAMPEETPALYSLMNYAGLKLGTWYPQGGFGKVVQGFVDLATKLGVTIHYNQTITQINLSGRRATSLSTANQTYACDTVIASADYHHVEKQLLNSEFRNYSDDYWKKKTMAPSCLVYYIGVNRKLPELNHHTLFFDTPLYKHSTEIYKDPKYPTDPLFYVCCPSKTDTSVAPDGCENLFLLMPLAPGLHDTEEIREDYFNRMMNRIEKNLGLSFRNDIVYKKSYCINDFVLDYNAYKGNAYGLANTLMQTAIMKPKIRNKRIKNLYYAGQLTVPGPGVPPSIISGKIAAQLILNEIKSIPYETVI